MTDQIHVQKLHEGAINVPSGQPQPRTYRLLFIRSGSGTIAINYRKHAIQPDRIFLIPPQTAQEPVDWTGSGWAILFGEPRLRLFFQQYPEEKVLPLFFHGKKPYADLLKSRTFEVQALILMIFKEFRQPEDQKIMQAYLNVLLLHLTGSYRLANKIALGRTDHVLIEKLFMLIHENFQQERLPAFYAGKLGLPVRKLNLFTKRATGKLALELITEQVLAEAEHLLAESPLSIKEIAYQLEFADMAQFSHFMTRHTGRSPKDFRQHTQG